MVSPSANSARPATAMSLPSASGRDTTASARPLTLGQCLVFSGGGLGDTLFHLAHYRALAACTNSGKIHLAVKKAKGIRYLFEHLDVIEAVHAAAKDEARSGKISVFNLVSLFRRLALDSVVSLHPSSTVALAARLAGVKQVYGFREGPSLFNHVYTDHVEVSPDRPAPPLMSGTDALLSHLRLPFDHDAERFPPSLETANMAESLIGALPRPTDPILAIGLNGSTAEKRWDIDRMISLIRRIASTGSFTFMLFGGADVAEDAARIKAAFGHSDVPDADSASPKHFQPVFLDADGRHGLAVDHALLARSALYIGNDSFGLNLAAFSGVPAVIGLFGVTDPLTYSRRIHPILPDTPHAGMGALSLDAVWSTVQPHLTQLQHLTS